MRKILLNAQVAYYTGMLNKHVANIEVLLNQPVGIGGVADNHQDIQEAIEVELGKVADYHDKIGCLRRYFDPPVETTKENKKDGKA